MTGQSHGSAPVLPDVRSRSAAELIDAAFRLNRRHLGLFAAITGVFELPVFPVAIVMAHRPPALGLLDLSFFIYSVLWSVLPSSIVTLLAADSYFAQPLDLGRAVRQTVRRAWPVSVVSIISSVLFFGGLLLLVVPGVIALIRLFAVQTAVLFENLNAAAALRRSYRLSIGATGRILGTVGVTFAASLIIGGILEAVAAELTDSVVIPVLVTTAFSIAITPLVSVLVMLVYFDIRIRKEGYDLELMSQNLDAGSAGRDESAVIA